MASLVDTIRGALPANTIDALADNLGESHHATGTALGGIVPVILGAIAGKVESGGAADVVDLIKNALARGNPLDNPDALAGGTMGKFIPERSGGLASSLLGSSFGPIAAQLAERFGLKVDSIRALLGIGGLSSAGGIGRALGGNPTPQGLSDLVRSERPAIAAALPPGIGGLLGSIGGSAGAAASRGGEAAGAAGTAFGKWLPWILLVIAAVIVIIGLRSCNRNAAVPVATNTTGLPTINETAPAPITEPVAPVGSGAVSEMRDGRPALIVYFDVGKSDVSKDLAPAASAVKDYLAANPNARLAVSGFNDPTGNAAANAALSKERAQNVAAALEATGIPGGAISLEKPVDTTNGGGSLAESRRVEVTIRQ
jgi:outer membrane protein OmpA-like peptidoglycan-associated protein